MARIGIYSGAFDPVHDGHLQFALYAARQCELDRVMFMPEPEPRLKQGVKALQHRQNMVTIATAQHKKLGSILLDQTQFTIDKTLPVLQSRFSGSELFFLLGDDVIENLINWPHLHVLINSCSFIIGLRKKTAEDVVHTMTILESTLGRAITYELIAVGHTATSSKRVRSIIKQHKRPRTIDDGVYQYILDNGLYLRT